MSGGKDLEQRIDTIIDCINRECDDLITSERTMVLLYLKEVMGSVVHTYFANAISEERESEAEEKSL